MSFAISRAVASVAALRIIEEQTQRAEREHATRPQRRSRRITRALRGTR